MKGKISNVDQNHFLNQAVNMFFSAVKLVILTWGVYGTDSLLQPASSGQSMNCSFSHFLIGWLPLGFNTFRIAGRAIKASAFFQNIPLIRDTYAIIIDFFYLGI